MDSNASSVFHGFTSITPISRLRSLHNCFILFFSWNSSLSWRERRAIATTCPVRQRSTTDSPWPLSNFGQYINLQCCRRRLSATSSAPTAPPARWFRPHFSASTTTRRQMERWRPAPMSSSSMWVARRRHLINASIRYERRSISAPRRPGQRRRLSTLRRSRGRTHRSQLSGDGGSLSAPAGIVAACQLCDLQNFIICNTAPGCFMKLLSSRDYTDDWHRYSDEDSLLYYFCP